jgi:hypothetical protein
MRLIGNPKISNKEQGILNVERKDHNLEIRHSLFVACLPIGRFNIESKLSP